ncbi:hypothetical protein [Endothiovibrio diazotrophicus]
MSNPETPPLTARSASPRGGRRAGKCLEPLVEGVAATPAETVREARTLAATVTAYTEERDLLNQMIGQVQMATTFRKMADVVSLSKLDRIKRSKAYKALKGQTVIVDEEGKMADVGTWQGFCAALGMSASKVDEDLLNLREFGEEALASMNRIGLGYRELRKLRKLPEEGRVAVIGELEVDTGDREAVVSLIEDLAARHAGERAELEGRLQEAAASATAKDRVIEEKSRTIEQLHHASARREQLGAEALGEELSTALERRARDVLGTLLQLRAEVAGVVERPDCPLHLRLEAGQAVARIIAAAREVQADFALLTSELEGGDDAWMQQVPATAGVEH